MTAVRNFGNAELMCEGRLNYYLRYKTDDGIRQLHITSGEAYMCMTLEGAVQYIVSRYACTGVVGELIKEDIV